MRPILNTFLLCGTIFAAPVAQAAETVTIPNNVASWVAQATRIAAVPENTQLPIVVHLALRDADRLKAFVDAVSKPGNPTYGQYLTVSGLRARFAPDPADVGATVSLLRKAGMRNVTAGPAGVYVSASATPAQLAAAFGVSQSYYVLRGQSRRANSEAPRVPASLAGKVLSIEGLDDGNRRHTNAISVVQGKRVMPPAGRSAQDSAVTPPPVASFDHSPYCDTYVGDLRATLSTRPAPYGAMLPWIGCGYTPQQIRQAYGMNKVAQDGTGVNIVIVDAYASPTLMADGNTYARNHHLPRLTSANFTQIIPEGIYDVPADQINDAYNWWFEESLDLDAVHGAAPGAHITYVGSTDDYTSLTVALTNAIYNREGDIISNSYEYVGDIDSADTQAQDQTFMSAAAMGITLLFSSGDYGDLSEYLGVANASFESDSAYVTGVGGTSLALFAPNGRKGEWGWSNYADTLANAQVNSATSVTTSGLTTTTAASGQTYSAFQFYEGSGGGITLQEAQPAYQQGIVPTLLATTQNYLDGTTSTSPTNQRVAPDVAMVADPYTGYLVGETFTIAGDPIPDYGCKPVTGDTEYCEFSAGGTSLATPLMAGVIAMVDQAHIAAGRPLLGFANPFFYNSTIGAGLTDSGINDVQAPKAPYAILQGFMSDLTYLLVVPINSVPLNIPPGQVSPCLATVCEGLDEVFNYTAVGYDDVTGLGVPYVPKLLNQ